MPLTLDIPKDEKAEENFNQGKDNCYYQQPPQKMKNKKKKQKQNKIKNKPKKKKKFCTHQQEIDQDN